MNHGRSLRMPTVASAHSVIGGSVEGKRRGVATSLRTNHLTPQCGRHKVQTPEKQDRASADGASPQATVVLSAGVKGSCYLIQMLMSARLCS